MSTGKDTILTSEQLDKIIEIARRESYVPVQIECQGDERLSVTHHPYLLGKVRVYKFTVNGQGHTKYEIQVGTQGNERKQVGTIFRIYPLQRVPNKRVIRSIEMDTGSYLSCEGAWEFHVLHAALCLAQWTLRTILREQGAGMFDTTALIDREQIDSDSLVDYYQERFNVSRPARPKKKVAHYAPETKYYVENSNPLASSQVHQVIDPIVERARQMGFNIRYRSRYGFGHYDWKYKFTVEGHMNWNFTIGTTAHYNGKGHDGNGDVNKVSFSLYNNFHHGLIVNTGGRQLDTLIQDTSNLRAFQIVLALGYQMLNVIYSTPRHLVDDKKLQQLIDQSSKKESAHSDKHTLGRSAAQGHRSSTPHIHATKSFRKSSPSQPHADKNLAYLSGYILHKPFYHVTKNGHAVANFIIASHRGYRKANGDEAIDYINCVVWNDGARQIHDQTRRNVHVGLVGIMHNRGYEDRSVYNHSGQKRYFTELIVHQFYVLHN